MCTALHWLRTHDGGGAFAAERSLFLQAARASFGTSALILSGGAIFGVYHYGVVKGLLEQGMLPRVISGASAGAVVAAVACCFEDDELARDRHF